MNYKQINLSILDGKDYISKEDKAYALYQYLITNNVAYYYSKEISMTKNSHERKIIKIGNNFNKKYIKTLKFFNNICTENNIPFLLFKTHKYINEAIDGDIDILVKEKDFYTLLNKLKEKGFKREKERILKASCKKRGFKKIEPRTCISFSGLIILNEHELWKHTETVSIGGMNIKKTSKYVDLFSFLLSILYGPSYLRFYHYVLYDGIDESQLLKLASNVQIKEDLEFVLKQFFRNKEIEKKFPLFIKNIDFLTWWIKRILFNKDVLFKIKIKQLLFAFYVKCKYIFFGKLVFTHKWY